MIHRNTDRLLLFRKSHLWSLSEFCGALPIYFFLNLVGQKYLSTATLLFFKQTGFSHLLVIEDLLLVLLGWNSVISASSMPIGTKLPLNIWLLSCDFSSTFILRQNKEIQENFEKFQNSKLFLNTERFTWVNFITYGSIAPQETIKLSKILTGW